MPENQKCFRGLLKRCPQILLRSPGNVNLLGNTRISSMHEFTWSACEDVPITDDRSLEKNVLPNVTSVLKLGMICQKYVPRGFHPDADIAEPIRCLDLLNHERSQLLLTRLNS